RVDQVGASRVDERLVRGAIAVVVETVAHVIERRTRAEHATGALCRARTRVPVGVFECTGDREVLLSRAATGTRRRDHTTLGASVTVGNRCIAADGTDLLATDDFAASARRRSTVCAV